MKMSTPLVTVFQGKLRGTLGKNIIGEEFFKFLGVPYAKPPGGELRFKAPQPAEPWDGTRNCTEDGPQCFGREERTGAFGGSEDCLFLNIYTKKLPDSSSGLKPVMVFFHGGGFILGSNNSTLYGPEVLLTEDIVLVVLNYRLGILGFLSIDDTSLGVPGNAGLKDQNLALKWIQENIHIFNGDPNNVTLFGNSAGGASVHFHMLSPLSKGLFHKVILQSGCSLNSWAYGHMDIKDFTKKLGRDIQTDSEALEVLIKTPVEKLYQTQEACLDQLFAGFKRPFGPVIEKPNPAAFLTEDPIQTILSGNYVHVPMIVGYSNREGMIVEINEAIGLPPVDIPEVEASIPWQLQIQNDSEKQNIVNALNNLYFKEPNVDDNNYVYIGDTMFLVGLFETIRLHLKTSKNAIYLYRLSAETELNFFKQRLTKLKNCRGVCHADEIGYLFKYLPEYNVSKGSVEEKLTNAFVKLWTNFAKFGNPTPSNEIGIVWQPVDDGNAIKFLDIDTEITLQLDPEKERLHFWRNLLKKYLFVTKFK